MKAGPTASQRPLAVPSHVLQMKNSAIPSPTLQKAGTSLVILRDPRIVTWMEFFPMCFIVILRMFR